MSKNKKNQVAKISVFITSIFIIFLSITYAFINMTIFGTKRQVITAGNLELEFEEDNAVVLENAMPMYDEVGMIQDAFNFRLVNKSSIDIDYIVKLVDITTGEKLDTNIVKYGFTKDGENIIKLLSTLKDDRELDSGIIKGEQTIHYSFRLWVDSSVEDNSSISGKSLSYRIDVIEGQAGKLNVVPGGTLKEFVTADLGYFPECNEEFCKNKNSITSIVFENKISIPDTVADDLIWDVSEEQNNSVMVYLEEDGVSEYNSEIKTYRLHFQGENGVYANPNCNYLFSGFIYLKKIEGLENFNTSKVTDMSGMFARCRRIVNLDLSHFDTSNVTNMSDMFDENESLLELILDNFDTSKVTNTSGMFYDCSSLVDLDLSHFDTSNVMNMSSMFNGCDSLASLDLSKLDTSNVTSMASMFSRCTSLTNLDLSNFNTSNVTNMGRMFSGLFIGCTSLTNLDLSHFDTSKVKNMAGMFSGCKYLTNLNVLSFNTSNVTDMYGMFDGCSLTSLDLRHFNTSRVTDMAYMFFECKNLTNLTISSFDTSNVTNMSSMFSGCAHLSSLNIGNFVTSKVTDMRDMFQNCGVLASLNFKNSDTSNVTDMSNMFSGCTKLLTLQLGNFIVPEKSSGVLSRPFGYIADIVPSNCKITVKNQASKAQILKTDNRFTNITVTG